MPVCISCGASYEQIQEKCPFCGRENESIAGTVCPVCRKEDRVFKVSLIFDIGHNYLISSSSSQVEDKYRKLAPPIKPKIEKKHPIFHIILILTISVIFLLMSISQIMEYYPYIREQWFFKMNSFIVIYNIVIFTLGTLGLVNVFFKIYDNSSIQKRINENYEEELDSWKRMMNRWKELYYCSRDDVVFIPNERKAFQALDMMDILNHPG